MELDWSYAKKTVLDKHWNGTLKVADRRAPKMSWKISLDNEITNSRLTWN